jgi:hypothetical protein
MKIFFSMGKMVGAGAGAEIFDKPEPHKNGPAPQHCVNPQHFKEKTQKKLTIF